MPVSCCAGGCTNRCMPGTKFSFYRFPHRSTIFERNRRELWLKAFRRKNSSEEMLKTARLCSAHFITGKRSNNPSHPDFVPTIFEYTASNHLESTKKAQRLQRFKCRAATTETKLTEIPAETMDTESDSQTIMEQCHVSAV